MRTERLPEDVVILLRDHIESYEQLELLLLLRSAAEISWTEAALCSRVRVPGSLIAAALGGLQSAGLIAACSDRGVTRYSYRAQSASLESTIGRLAQAYREHPMPVIKLMSANAIERVRTAALRTFADAFIVRKDKDGG